MGGLIMILAGIGLPVGISIWAGRLVKAFGSESLRSPKVIIFLVLFYCVGIALIVWGITLLTKHS
jgi:hypothetical protein